MKQESLLPAETTPLFTLVFHPDSSQDLRKAYTYSTFEASEVRGSPKTFDFGSLTVPHPERKRCIEFFRVQSPCGCPYYVVMLRKSCPQLNHRDLRLLGWVTLT
ncbi:hypothetical protein [Coleofasciculus sp. H7-2]|uniref:hypothetical protein n=1 Tax=Coleofasciculus sp. H7-2 TaxID=3351545 RepID=UPI00366A8454